MEIDNVTEYLRGALAARNNGVIEFKDKDFWIITNEELSKGVISEDIANKIIEAGNESGKNKDEKKDVKIIIVVKTIKDEFSDGEARDNKIDELTGIYYMPARVLCDGTACLKTSPDKWPWIPREFLYPMVDEQLSVGKEAALDEFFENTTGRRDIIRKSDNWEEYFSYSRDLYENVTRNEFLNETLDSDQKEFYLSNEIYVFLDDTINTTFNILKLYEDINSLNFKGSALYKRFIKLDIEASKEAVKNDEIHMIKHCGQMNGNYPLAPSQRNAINHFVDMCDGEILAVNGPPGTGKTTLLQSVVANLYLERAIEEKDPPIIVAASANNQAVTNIIESFGKVDVVGISNLEKRWITGVESFAVYFPSESKKNAAFNKGYQVTSQKGDGFASKVDDEVNIQQSENLMIESTQAYFGQKFFGVNECKKKIHCELLKIEEMRTLLIKRLSHIQNITNGEGLDKYIDNNRKRISEISSQQKKLEKEIEDLSGSMEQCKRRAQEWVDRYNSIHLLIRLLSFIKTFKRKIYANLNSYKTEDELEFLKDDMLLEDILECYNQKRNQLYNQSNVLKEKSESLLGDIKELETFNEKCILLKKECEDIIYILVNQYQCNVDIEKIKEKLNMCNLDEFNDIIDVHIRYIEFWLAVHYFECRWILREYAITEKQRGMPYENVIKSLYRRLALIAPCMVMTFFVLPKELRIKIANDKKYTYLYNYIDLLIVDEAGQVSPEIAAASFSLAKKAIVVGDEKQLAPIWGTQRALDIALAIEHGVIEDKDEYNKLINSGLNCSESSVMRVASNSCKYEQYGKGLFLCEHRRCYNKIIAYCNELVYKGHLQPMRGNGDDKYPFCNLPKMGHYDTNIESSERVGKSRRNKQEAKVIAEWLKNNYKKIFNAYGIESPDAKKADSIIGIVTPFKAQIAAIKNELRNCLPEKYSNKILVGTVHSLQGAERNIVIFSSVYGGKDGCFFINKNESLMNVAVSRAKDAFLVFGARGCLDLNGSSASALLRRSTVEKVPLNIELR